MWFKSSMLVAAMAFAIVQSVQADEAKEKAELMKMGQTVYMQVCVACHQPTGMGLPPMFPPLAGSDWITTDVPEILPRIVLHGLQGPIKINGKVFNSPAPMPPQGMVLDNKKIAAALTYARNSWGNKGSVITEAMVGEIRKKEAARKTMWTEAELEKIKKEIRNKRKKK